MFRFSFIVGFRLFVILGWLTWTFCVVGYLCCLLLFDLVYLIVGGLVYLHFVCVCYCLLLRLFVTWVCGFNCLIYCLLFDFEDLFLIGYCLVCLCFVSFGFCVRLWIGLLGYCLRVFSFRFCGYIVVCLIYLFLDFCDFSLTVAVFLDL